MHQWVKNLLVFGAFLLSHGWNDAVRLAACVQAFIAFNLFAWSVYRVNDLPDLETDRQHPLNDPVWFAVRDPATYYLGVCPAILLYLTTGTLDRPDYYVIRYYVRRNNDVGSNSPGVSQPRRR